MSERRKRWPFAAALLCAGLTAQAAETLIDPTRPSSATAPASATNTAAVPRTPSWRVESIIVSPGRRLAIVNGHVVGVNDRIDGARVLEILPYEVRLEYKGETRKISLLAARIKRPVD